MLSNSVIFSGKPMGSEEFLNHMIEVLGITIIDIRSKRRPSKREN